MDQHPRKAVSLGFDVKAHKDTITSLTVMEVEPKLLISAGLDMSFKIWSMRGERLCFVNINKPLPFQWAISMHVDDKVKKRVVFGIKVIQIIFKKYANDISIG